MFEVDVMKVILSRKGFDSQYGGYPSPILPKKDGRLLISLPIPSNDNIHYNDLKIENQTYYEIMKYLNPKIRYEGMRHELTKETKCHLDPDIYQNIRKRPKYWKPIFGQINAAQSHLENERVTEGNIFLFFGTFRKTMYKENRLYFVPKEPELHIIFGYLQIGKIMKIRSNTRTAGWMDYHPHIDSDERRKSRNNTIYIASDTLSWNSNLSGAGTFNFHEDLVLTKKGGSKSRWDLPSFFKEVKISYHSKKSWKANYFQSTGKGQEFVIHSNEKIEKWVKKLISTRKD